MRACVWVGEGGEGGRGACVCVAHACAIVRCACNKRVRGGVVWSGRVAWIRRGLCSLFSGAEWCARRGEGESQEEWRSGRERAGGGGGEEG